MVNICIIHYNTPLLTECLIKSINKFTPDSKIYIFDNSDKYPFTYRQDNIVYFDNTKGQIINFEEWLKKYPNHEKSLGKRSKWGSFKHCISVEKCFELINDNFILLDSDVLLKKDISELFNSDYYSCGEIKEWSWGTNKNIFPIHKRILPFLCFINVIKCIKEGIHYFNEEYMDGLYDSMTQPYDKEQLNRDSYDTGCWFYEQLLEKPIKKIKSEKYIVHFRGGSYTEKGREENLTKKQWLQKYKNLYNNKIEEKKPKKDIIKHKIPLHNGKRRQITFMNTSW